MNARPTVPVSYFPVDLKMADAEVISVADRMQAARASLAEQGEGELPLWPLEPSLEEQIENVRQQMMLQPFIEFLFYGEEEETGNVSLSTML